MLVLLILVLLIVLYLYLIMPRIIRRPSADHLKGRYYAHRGLHDNLSGPPENSIDAFQKAIDAGYGIELDVQLTQDRIPVVFHDENLQRICGIDGRVRDFTYAELSTLPLLGSHQCIPLLSDVLELVDGQVPLIIEIKAHENPVAVCEKADEWISRYQGPYCIESFHPGAVQWYKENRPDVVRGQLSANFARLGKREKPAETLVHHLLTNVLCRPDFIAYDHRTKNVLSRIICKKLFGALSVAWTIRSQEELDAARADFDLFIFEQFIPKD
ncbi:MAG: glycerophosphodiester phosphodiesterase [Clostridia bacterium]|nr:glycerophosphodiester phosphodiesterase [Clostridia bacterium]